MTDYEFHFQKDKKKKENTSILLENELRAARPRKLAGQKARWYLPGTRLPTEPNEAQGLPHL